MRLLFGPLLVLLLLTNILEMFLGAEAGARAGQGGSLIVGTPKIPTPWLAPAPAPARWGGIATTAAEIAGEVPKAGTKAT